MNSRMLAITVVAYFIIALFIGEVIGPNVSVWAAPLIAVVFVLVYVIAGRGRLTPPIVWVALATLVVPVSFLAFVGIPVYGSLRKFAQAIASVPGFISPFAIVDMAIPLIASMITVVVLKVMRSNKSFERTGENRG